MTEIDQFRIGGLDPSLPNPILPPPRKVTRLLLLWPLAGFVAFVAAMVAYRPLDDTLLWCVGGGACLITYTLINIAWRKAQRGEDVRSFFPRPAWLAIASLFVPAVLFLNGALDHSPVERHRQVVSRTILEHGRHGSIDYYLEVTSWRTHHAREKISVSESKYLDFKVGDAVIVETHRGALGIPLLVSAHWPD